MRRAPFLQPLSREHYIALKLAKALSHFPADEGARLSAEVGRAMTEELLPHFAEEERLILEPLAARGEGDLVARTRAEHAQLETLADRVAAGDRAALREFGILLADHVRFEERELFEAAQAAGLDDPAPVA